MRKIRFSALLAVLCCIAFSAATTCLALDEGGCLICHQYPGLVTWDEPGGLKVLHIDEGKYFASVHGRFRCTECHTTITKVPHAGETAVSCTVGCHFDDADRIADYPLEDFHSKEQSSLIGMRDESACRVCHPLYPHRTNTLVRALLNMHTVFMLCEVCHIKRDQFVNLSYDWDETHHAQFKGEPFGTHYDPNLRQAAARGKKSVFRIGALITERGVKRPLEDPVDRKRATAFMRQEKRLSAEEKEKRLEYFHRDIEKKEISVQCNECHSATGIMDFKGLGFSERECRSLRFVNIKQLVTQYNIFYFPRLFER